MRALLVVATVSCVLVAGCGTAENEPNLAAAVERTEAQGSGRFELHGVQKMDGKTADFECLGEAEYASERVRVDCEYIGAGDLEAIAIGNDFYIRGALWGGTGEKWIKLAGDVDDESSLASLSPEKLLTLLRDASSETERIGEEEVRGTSTVRYRLTVDCEAAELDCATTAPVDVWIGDDGVVRRIALEDEDGSASFEFFDFGADVDIEPPPADEVVEEDLFPGASSTGGGTSEGIEVTCAEAEAMPISQRRAIAVLRQNGFQMADSEFCIVDNAGSAGEVPGPGLVTCGVDAKPRAGAPTRVRRGTADHVDATFELHNLKCSIETGPEDRERKTARLELAFTELEQAIRP